MRFEDLPRPWLLAALAGVPITTLAQADDDRGDQGRPSTARDAADEHAASSIWVRGSPAISSRGARCASAG